METFQELFGDKQNRLYEKLGYSDNEKLFISFIKNLSQKYKLDCDIEESQNTGSGISNSFYITITYPPRGMYNSRLLKIRISDHNKSSRYSNMKDDIDIDNSIIEEKLEYFINSIKKILDLIYKLYINKLKTLSEDNFIDWYYDDFEKEKYPYIHNNLKFY